MSRSEHNKDHRQFARFELLEYAMIVNKDSNESSRSVIIDVSLGGLQVRSRHQFPIGGNYMLNISRADADPLVVEAEARYCIQIEDTDLFATGFRCLPATTAQRMQWVDYVHAIFQSHGEHLVS
jgi:hypothetical protein